jgi:hypothetical protein
VPLTWDSKTADDAVAALKLATAQVGITLPSLSRDFSSLDNPLVELGRARPDVVKHLADCLVELVELRGMVESMNEEAKKETVSADG